MKNVIELPSWSDIQETKFDEIDAELILLYYQTETSHENDHDTAIIYKKNSSFILYHEHENAEQESFYTSTIEVCNLGNELNYFMDKEFVDYIKACALNYKLDTSMSEKPVGKKNKI